MAGLSARVDAFGKMATDTSTFVHREPRYPTGDDVVSDGPVNMFTVMRHSHASVKILDGPFDLPESHVIMGWEKIILLPVYRYDFRK